MIDEQDIQIVIIAGPEHVQQMNMCLWFMTSLYPDIRIKVLTSLEIFQGIDTGLQGIQSIDENSVVDKGEFASMYGQLFGGKRRFSWYYQQFLKLNFHTVSETSNYVVWDCDTIPMKRIPFIKDGKFLFNRKTEHHVPYFVCMKRLLDVDRQMNHSFISEYMVMNRDCVLEMVQTIEQNHPGNWIESVLKCVSEKDRFHSGFSEYETYGNFMFKYHRDICDVISLATNRNGKKQFGNIIPSLDQLKEFAGKTNLDTITFEKW